MPAACASAEKPYRRREPEESLLHQVLRLHLNTFVATHDPPRHVRRAAGKENDTPWSLARGTQGVTRKALPPPPGRTSPGPGVGGESRAETGEGQAARSGGERCTSST